MPDTWKPTEWGKLSPELKELFLKIICSPNATSTYSHIPEIRPVLKKAIEDAIYSQNFASYPIPRNAKKNDPDSVKQKIDEARKKENNTKARTAKEINTERNLSTVVLVNSLSATMTDCLRKAAGIS